MKKQILFAMVLSVIIVFLNPETSQNQPEIIRGIIEGEYRGGEQESPYQARQQAKKMALRKFTEENVGILVSSLFVDIKTEKGEGEVAKSTYSQMTLSLVDVWASAHVRIDSVYIDLYKDYIAHYRALVSAPMLEIEHFRNDVAEIQASTRETRKRELVEITKHRYAVTADLEDMVLVPAEKGEPPFYISRYPASVIEYRRFEPSYYSNSSYLEAATNVTWEKAQEYCRSKGGRLPTDIE